MTDQDIQTIADLLKTLEPGFLPYPIFEQIARLVTLPIIEFIPLRLVDSATEVLLIQRPADDRFWPGLLHTPGTVVRATDDQNQDQDWGAFQRILHDELKDTKVGPPHYVGSAFRSSKRGTEQAQLYWVEVLEEPRVGQFYPVDQLPDGLIEAQIAFIHEVVRHFQQYKRAKD